MKELFYSEELNKYFDSKEECERAEFQYKQDKLDKEAKLAAAEEKKREELALASKEKKELSKAVEEATQKVTEAYNAYDLAREDCEKLREEYESKITKLKADYKEEYEAILSPVKEAIKKAEKEKYEAIAAYNKKYGTYSVIYSGEKAFDEFKRFSTLADRLFKDFWF